MRTDHEHVESAGGSRSEGMHVCLLFKIQRYLGRTGMPETKFGRLAVNDPRLVGDLRRGREPGAKLTARVERFIMVGQRRPLGESAMR